jgi:type IV pilus assembly protein PilW
MNRQRGLTLIELMIAIALGLIILLAITTIFANTSRSRTEMEKSNRQTENGRYASQLLANNLRMAGYLAEFDPSPLTTPVALPDPCATDAADLIAALSLHVQGVDNAAAVPSCLGDVKAGTDIIVIRRTSSCATGSADCTAFSAGTPHFQASLCSPDDGTELAFPITGNADYAAHYFTLATGLTDFTKHRSDCTTLSDIYRYQVHIYFIANNNEAGDGIPTLKRWELGTGIVPLVDGIENMQIEYGVDTDNNGTPDIQTPAPADVAAWRNVMSARVHLLVRNTENTVGHTDNKTYTLGNDAADSAVVVGPFGDAHKRRVFASTTHFANPSWRRQ